MFATVMRVTTLRLFLAIVAIGNPGTHQMDVNVAFLNGDPDLDILVVQPKGFVKYGNPSYT